MQLDLSPCHALYCVPVTSQALPQDPPPYTTHHSFANRLWTIDQMLLVRLVQTHTPARTHLVMPPVHADVLQCDVDVPPLSKGKGSCDRYEWTVIPATSSPKQCSA